ncbi:unnamed protein product [Gordionus sp. m RMFG-2023]
MSSSLINNNVFFISIVLLCYASINLISAKSDCDLSKDIVLSVKDDGNYSLTFAGYPNSVFYYVEIYKLLGDIESFPIKSFYTVNNATNANVTLQGAGDYEIDIFPFTIYLLFPHCAYNKFTIA